MLDFPSSPQVDDTMTGPSGQVWRWDGIKWVAVGGGGGGPGGGGDIENIINVGTTPPVDPHIGMLWINDDMVYIREDAGWIPLVKMTRWTPRAVPADLSWLDIAFGNGVFVAVATTITATGQSLMTSPDGINWTLISQPDIMNLGWTSIRFSNGRFVAASSGTIIATSINGITWTTSSPIGSNNNIRKANDIFFAFPRAAATSIATSPDGLIWTTRTVPSGLYQGVAYGNNLYVFVSNSAPRLMRSSDLVNFTTYASPDDSVSWTSIDYGGSRFAIVCPAKVATSSDGINWTQIGIPSGFAAGTWSNLRYLNGLFIAVNSLNQTGLVARVLISRDNGVTWLVRNAPSDASWNAVDYGNGAFVAVAITGTVNRAMTTPSP